MLSEGRVLQRRAAAFTLYEPVWTLFACGTIFGSSLAEGSSHTFSLGWEAELRNR